MKWLIVLDFLDNIRVLECPAKLVRHLSRHSIGISFIFSIPSPYHSWLTPLSSMLTDMLTHICISHCLLIDYKASIILLPIPSFWLISAYHSLLIDLLTDHPPCLLISLLIPYSYMLIPLLTDCLQTPYCSLTNPLQILLTPLLSVFEILCFPHVYKAPWSSEEPRWNPLLNSTKLSLSKLVSLSLPLFFESCRLQCKSKGFSIQVNPSLLLLKYFPRLRRSLGSPSTSF